MKEILDHVQGYEDTIYAFTVGSEGLYRYEQSKKKVGYTTEDLLRRINSFKQQVSSAPYNLAKKVGTADSWNKYQDGTADGLVTGGVDLLYFLWRNSPHSFADKVAGLLTHLAIGNHKTSAMQVPLTSTICSKPMAAYNRSVNPLRVLSSGTARLAGRAMVS